MFTYIKKDMSVYVLGDIHGEFGKLNTFINRKKPDVIICCGDFGYWREDFQDPESELCIGEIIPKQTKIFWCDGNHEDHNSLQYFISGKDLSSPIECCDNIFYCPRGSFLQLNTTKFLFLGGALSVDKEYRTPMVDWFPNETLSDDDLKHLTDENIDIIISHTNPKCVNYKLKQKYKDMDKFLDPSTEVLQDMYIKYNPKKWYFGHYHFFNKFIHDNCEFTVLDYIEHNNRWFENIDV